MRGKEEVGKGRGDKRRSRCRKYITRVQGGRREKGERRERGSKEEEEKKARRRDTSCTLCLNEERMKKEICGEGKEERG